MFSVCTVQLWGGRCSVELSTGAVVRLLLLFSPSLFPSPKPQRLPLAPHFPSGLFLKMSALLWGQV